MATKKKTAKKIVKKTSVKKKVTAKKKVATKKPSSKKTVKPTKKTVRKKATKKTVAKKTSPKKKTKASAVKKATKATKATVKKAKVSLTKTKTAKKKAKTSKKTSTKPSKRKVDQLDPAILKIRERLIVNRAELLKLIQASQSVERDAGDLTFSNEIDLASSLEGREMTFQLTSRDRNELKLIEEILFRINNGSYGDCDSCEKKITLKRLQIMPLATLCIECQEDAENL
ncbi:TraR/DksA family transcriptional regulator [Nitrospinae bacterium]|nr:TraR/DksA family transcriptional regulator [Nitrospinota bacterium]